LDPTFNGTGSIGNSDGSAGTGNGEFNGPFDVAVSPDGSEIDVSDSNNHRIQRFAPSGAFIASFGSLGSDLSHFNHPKGLSFGKDSVVQIVDWGNNRLVFARDGGSAQAFGQAGGGDGQFQNALNVVADRSGVYVADTGNNRIQKLIASRVSAPDDDTAALTFSWSISMIPGLSNPGSLSQPGAVAIVSDLCHELIYIADTGNNRIVKVELPKGTPEDIWADFRQKLMNGDIDGAMTDVFSTSVPNFRQEFLIAGNGDLNAVMAPAWPITAVFIDEHTANYRYTYTDQGQVVTFLIGFVKENGKWKVASF
jgi:DNA-binding beta-propeller fold protein YncE